MSPGELALLTDARLSRESRIMGLHVASLGDGEHQVSHETFRRILGRGPQGMAKDSTIAGYVVELESYGWIERKAGGRGSPIYIFTPPLGEGRAPTFTHLPEDRKDSPHLPEGGIPSVSPPPSGGQTPPSSSYPLPLLPPVARGREAISLESDAAITDSGDLLVGCRGTLRDYLVARVDLEHQHGYVRRLAAALNGADEWMWKDRRGRTMPKEGRAAIVAAALNELLACSEVGKHFPESVGGFGNLRAKVRYLVASALGAEDDAKKTPAAPAVAVRARQKFPTPEVSKAS